MTNNVVENPPRPQSRVVNIGEKFTLIDPTLPDFTKTVYNVDDSLFYQQNIEVLLPGFQDPFPFKIGIAIDTDSPDDVDPNARPFIAVGLDTNSDELERRGLTGENGIINPRILLALQVIGFRIHFASGRTITTFPGLSDLTQAIYQPDALLVKNIINQDQESSASDPLSLVKSIKGTFIAGVVQASK